MEGSAQSDAGYSSLVVGPVDRSLQTAGRPTALQRAHDLSAPACVGWTLAALALGTTLRLSLVTYSSFPLGDGGMFYTMVHNLLSHGFRLPAYTTYNHLHIPFDYPPLGFYAVALLHTVFNWPLLDIFRLFPPLVSVLTIGAFALLAFSLLPSRVAAVVATFAFALDPDAFEWQIKGGGITRSPGTFFAILFLWQLTLLYKTGRWRHAVPAAAFAALIALSHPEWISFAAVSACALAIGLGRNRRALVQSAVVCASALALISPWLVAVISRSGITPFLATLGGSNGQSPWYIQLTTLAEFDFSRQMVISVPAVLGILGIIALLARRQYLLPAWFAAIFMTTLRGPQYKAVIVLALLAGIGAAYVLVPLARGRFPGPGPRRVRLPQLLPAVLALCALQAWFAAGASASMLEPTLTAHQRTAMTWVRLHTPQYARFLVVSGSPDWAHEVVGEWFPTLSGRASVDTVQGSEWLSAVYGSRISLYEAAQKCAYAGDRCVVRLLRRSVASVSYIFVAKGPPPLSVSAPELSAHDCCAGLRWSLGHSPRFTMVYNGPGAAIFEIAGSHRKSEHR